ASAADERYVTVGQGPASDQADRGSATQFQTRLASLRGCDLEPATRRHNVLFGSFLSQGGSKDARMTANASPLDHRGRLVADGTPARRIQPCAPRAVSRNCGRAAAFATGRATSATERIKGSCGGDTETLSDRDDGGTGVRRIGFD